MSDGPSGDTLAEEVAHLREQVAHLERDLAAQRQQSRQMRKRLHTHQLALSKAPVILFALNEHGEIKLVEGAQAAALNLTPESIGQNVADIYPNNPEILNSIRQAFDGKEAAITVKPGGSLILDLHCYPLQNDSGQVSGVMALAMDVSKHRQAEEALLMALLRTRELYEISHMIGMATSLSRVMHAVLSSKYLRDTLRASILYFDRPWSDSPPETVIIAFDWCQDESIPSLIGRQYAVEEYAEMALDRLEKPVIITDFDNLPLHPSSRAYIDLIKPSNLILFPLVSSGDWYGVLAIYYGPVELSEQTLSHLQGIVDQAAAAIHNMRLLQRESMARREAEKASEMKMRLLATVSHELRNPLTSIKGFATSLLADDVSWDLDTQRDFVETIDDEADKLTELVDQILAHARLETHTLRMERALTRFTDILQAAEPELRVLAASHHLAFDIPNDLPPVYADRHRIAQVLVNLVSNSSKYSPEHTTITIRANADNDRLQVSVLDEGVGITPEERERVFEPFHRMDEIMQHYAQGAGLGLSICKGIVETHGGDIWVAEEHNGPGTTITFNLPLYQPDEDVMSATV